MANQLKSEFLKLGVLDESRLFVGTVHGFCLTKVVHPYKQLCDVELPQPFRIAALVERSEALKLALGEQKLEVVDKELENMLRRLDKYRRRHPYLQPLESDGIDWSALAHRYTAILLHEMSESSIDFTYLEISALQMIDRFSIVRNALAAQFPFLAIDEYQDLGFPFHNMVLRLLESTSINVFAIGDADQCIYEFTGSDPKFIAELARRVEARDSTRAITLKKNYRNANEIISSCWESHFLRMHLRV